MDDYEEENEEEDGSLFDMLLPRDYAIDHGIDADSSGVKDSCLESDEEDGIVNVVEKGSQDIFDMPRAPACDATIDDDESESKHGSVDDDEEVLEDGSLFDMLLPRDCAIDDDIDTDSSDGEDEAANASAGCGFACQSPTERQALWEDLRRRQLAAEASESSGQQQQQRSYDDVDDTCVLPGEAAAPGGGGGPAASCACSRTTPEAQFTARELAMEAARRREAAQRELDRALAREAAAAAAALESELQRSATAERERRQATGVVAQPAVAKLDVRGRTDVTFIVCVYMLVFLVVSLLSLALPSN